jgi:hypothetical protein
MTDTEETVGFDDLISLCHVRHYDELGNNKKAWRRWTSALDGFHVNQKLLHAGVDSPTSLYSLTPLDIDHFVPSSVECRKYERLRMREWEDLRRQPKKSCLDLFCGAGGLSLGVSKSLLFDVKWGVDWDADALATFE